MYKFKLMTPLVILALSVSCQSSNLVSASDGKKVDKRLVGKWGGSEIDNQVVGMKKEWVMTRTPDGRFSLDFKITNGGTTDSWIEEGNWWVDKDKFYEYHEDSGKTDIYDYKVLSADQIQFRAISIGVEVDNEAYTFIDQRIK